MFILPQDYFAKELFSCIYNQLPIKLGYINWFNNFTEPIYIMWNTYIPIEYYDIDYASIKQIIWWWKLSRGQASSTWCPFDGVAQIPKRKSCNSTCLKRPKLKKTKMQQWPIRICCVPTIVITWFWLERAEGLDLGHTFPSTVRLRLLFFQRLLWQAGIKIHNFS